MNSMSAKCVLVLALFSPESQGGWRKLDDAAEAVHEDPLARCSETRPTNPRRSPGRRLP
jgi:hypothetical protein